MTGCGGKDNETEGDSSTLVIAIQEEIEGTDIQQIGWDNVVHNLSYTPLVTFSEDLSKVSSLLRGELRNFRRWSDHYL